jgi:hypothetical protein
VNLGLYQRKSAQALKDLYNISHQQITNYRKIAVICIKPFVDNLIPMPVIIWNI